jgi:hypothetical protein
MSLTDFKANMNKSKINKYKINNNNKTNTKHEFNVKYVTKKNTKNTNSHPAVLLNSLIFCAPVVFV